MNNTLNHPFPCVSNFADLVSMPMLAALNAICWQRHLHGDFAEIANGIELSSNMREVSTTDLLELSLSDAGQAARSILLNDIHLLQAHGASPMLNVIQHYEKDESFPFFPTDVYSFHVDRSPIPTDTFLCTYFGEASEILLNNEAHQKIHIPEIREALKKIYELADEDFDSFLEEHFFDLHYQALPHAKPINLGQGHIWRLAVDCPQSTVLPCIHRAPIEKDGNRRLLLIC